MHRGHSPWKPMMTQLEGTNGGRGKDSEGQGGQWQGYSQGAQWRKVCLSELLWVSLKNPSHQTYL